MEQFSDVLTSIGSVIAVIGIWIGSRKFLVRHAIRFSIGHGIKKLSEFLVKYGNSFPPDSIERDRVREVTEAVVVLAQILTEKWGINLKSVITAKRSIKTKIEDHVKAKKVWDRNKNRMRINNRNNRMRRG